MHGVPTTPQVAGVSMRPKPSGVVAGSDEVFEVLVWEGVLAVGGLGWNLPAGWLGQR